MSLPVTRLNHHHDGSQLQRVWLAACSLCCDTLSPEPGKRELPDTIFLPVSRTGTAARKGAPKCHYTTMVKGGLVLLKIVNGVKSGLLLEAHFRNDRIFYCVKKKTVAPALVRTSDVFTARICSDSLLSRPHFRASSVIGLLN